MNWSAVRNIWSAVRKPLAWVLLVLLLGLLGLIFGVFDPLVTIRMTHMMYPAHEKSKLFGIDVRQYPTDLQIYQEIISELKPDAIVEVGTWKGGLTFYLAALQMQVNPKGRVVTVDIWPDGMRDTLASPAGQALKHLQDRIDIIVGDSTAESTVQQVKDKIKDARTVLVLLDTLHEDNHVRKEMALYGPLVTVGSYLIVNDTFFDPPITWQTGQGPRVGVHKYLATHDEFVIDKERERFHVSTNPDGYLKRVK